LPRGLFFGKRRFDFLRTLSAELYQGGAMLRVRKYLIPALYGMALSLPLGVRVGVPLVLVQANKLGLFAEPSGTQAAGSVYTVDGLEGFVLTVHQPHQPKIRVQLAGLIESDGRWGEEATSIVAMLLEASQYQVKVQVITPAQGSSPAIALVKLPTGTYLQQILLAIGVAELDQQQVSMLPIEAAEAFQQAQVIAQSERKNIWHRG
jgi:hypothetical protein